MRCTVCATRGGEGSRAVQERAIDHARETGNKLIFLYVVNINKLDRFDETLKPAVRDELHWLGRTLLHIARQRAERSGVAADIVIREGDVREEIGRFLRDCSADLLLLGAPRETTAAIFGDDAIEQFAQSIQDETAVTVEVVRPAP